MQCEEFKDCVVNEFSKLPSSDCRKIPEEVVGQFAFLLCKGGNEDMIPQILEPLPMEVYVEFESCFLTSLVSCRVENFFSLFEIHQKVRKIFNGLLVDNLFKLFQETEQNLVSIFDQLHDVVYIHDVKGRVIFHNRSATDYFGEVRSIWEVLPEEYKEFLKSSYRKFETGEEEVFFERIRVITKDGKERIMEVKSKPFFRNGKIVAFGGIASDVTEKIMVEKQLLSNIQFLEEEVQKKIRELEETNRKLREINEYKDTALSQMAHELRTPLVPIKGYIDLLLKGSLGDLGDSQRRALEVVSRELDRFKNLIEALLTQSALQAGRITIKIEEFNIDELIEEVINRFSNSFNEKNLNIVKDLKGGMVVADRIKIEQVLHNLIENAVKFNKNGGSVKITTENNGSEVMIKIEDTGVGIDRSELNFIFEKYYRGRNVRGKKRGMGLGLYIVKEILQLHGSRFEVNSVINKGTVFTFYLPAGKI